MKPHSSSVVGLSIRMVSSYTLPPHFAPWLTQRGTVMWQEEPRPYMSGVVDDRLPAHYRPVSLLTPPTS